MSHSVTVTRTMTTSTATAIILNTGYMRTAPGLLKLFETIIGAVCLGLIAYYQSSRHGFAGFPEHTIFFLTTFAFLMTTFLMLLSALISLMASTVLSKTVFEFLYHLFAFIFYISSSLALITLVSKYDNRRSDYEGKMAAGVLGLVNSVLYLVSTLFSFRSYKSG